MDARHSAVPAAGTVGSVAGQLGKIRGARVVDIAGGAEKCRYLVDELGFDAGVDYKADDFKQQLEAATPGGVHVDFENVGGEVMRAVLSRMVIGGRGTVRIDLRLQRRRPPPR